ncbi:MAG: MazG-like family protein [Verrucomicrobiota bacterium]
MRQRLEGRGPTGLYALYLIELADNLGIDLFQAIRDKLAHNAAKYPVSRSKGSAAKYTEL